MHLETFHLQCAPRSLSSKHPRWQSTSFEQAEVDPLWIRFCICYIDVQKKSLLANLRGRQCIIKASKKKCLKKSVQPYWVSGWHTALSLSASGQAEQLQYVVSKRAECGSQISKCHRFLRTRPEPSIVNKSWPWEGHLCCRVI